MKTRPLGRTALEVTELSLGGAPLGNLYRAASAAEADATLSAAWEAGLRFFDTAPYYGAGLSERRMGDFLRGKPAGDYVLSTKVGRLLKPVAAGSPPDYGFVDPLPFSVAYDYSYDGILRSVEASHQRLGLGRIDVALVHDIGAYTHGEEANARHFRNLMDSGLKALEELKAAGAIGAYGLGVNEVAVCLDVMRRAPVDCILLAGRYTLLDRAGAAELVPLCRDKGTSLIVGGVFNSGILATGAVPGAYFDYGPAPEPVLAAVREMEAVAAANGVPLPAAALQFPLRDPVVATVLLGTASPELLARNLALAATPVPEAAWAAFDANAINR